MRDYPWVSANIRKTHARCYLSLHPYLQACYLWLETHAPLDAFLYITTGHRGPEAQEEAHRSGRSNAAFGQSFHNTDPALAMDIVPVWQNNPHTIEWSSPRTKELLANLAAVSKGILEWGGAWKSISGDIYHFQIPGDPSNNPIKAGLDALDKYSLSMEIKA